jgi:hypothetical protein
MPVRIQPIALWRAEVNDAPGVLARTLEPLAAARANLQCVMGYRLPGERGRAAIEIYPVSGVPAVSAAGTVGLAKSGIPALLVDGENRAGLGHQMTRALADAGINLEFLVALVTGNRYATVIGFENREDADRAIPLLRASAAVPKTPRRKTARKRAVVATRRAKRQKARRRR